MSRNEKRRRVLVVDDSLQMAETVSDGLRDHGYDAEPISSPDAALKMLEDGDFDAVVTDLRMPGIDGLNVLARSKRLAPERPVIVMTAYGAIDSAIESIRHGASHYLLKPFKLDELVIFLQRAFEQISLQRETAELRRALRDGGASRVIITEGQVMRDIVDTARRVADADAPVLILGETGTGKGLIARLLHDESRRAARPFLSLNCAALPEALLESELFGHVKGAFTGASSGRDGLFLEATGGTIFLDEIGDMAPSLQAKLLHVLERGVVRAVGGTTERPIDVRVVTATHRHVRDLTRSGAFRADLLYRIDVISIELPPLRARSEDLPVLIEHFFRRAKEKHRQSAAEHLGVEATRALLAYSWPGNVRELAHTLERVVLLAPRPEIEVADLPPSVRGLPDEPQQFHGDVVPLRRMQERYARWAMERLGGQRMRAAEALDIDPKTLARLIDETER